LSFEHCGGIKRHKSRCRSSRRDPEAGASGDNPKAELPATFFMRP
jgi:hypothetical protein